MNADEFINIFLTQREVIFSVVHQREEVCLAFPLLRIPSGGKGIRALLASGGFTGLGCWDGGLLQATSIS